MSTSSSHRPIVEIRQLAKSYGEKTIIRNLDLTIYDGEFLTLLGPSGCGKTTVLRMLAGLESVDSGEILLDGKDISQLPPEKRPLNTVFQSYALFPHMTVAQNVAFGLKMQKVAQDEIDRRVAEALKMVQLEPMADRKPDQLSGGQQQRIAIARAVVNRPKVLLLDESLSALDYKLRKQMQLELKQLQRKLGITFVFVTHDQEEALSMSDRIIVMREGHIEQQGSPREIYETPNNLFVARFIGEINILDAQITAIAEEANYYHANIEGVPAQVYCEKGWKAGDRVNVLLRPEDLRLEEIEKTTRVNGLTGEVVERTYKGMTLDSVVKLDSGKTMMVSEFFDEDDPDVDHSLGQRVAVTWVPKWEVVLNDEQS